MPPSILQAQTLRTPLVDSKGIVTQPGYWFLYSLFKGAQGAEATAATVDALPALIEGTHAQRLASTVASYTPGTLWFETDRGVFYIVSAAKAWAYAVGVYNAALAAIPSDLGAADANLRFGATDYSHEWRWDGAAWHFAPGHGSKFFQASDGTAPLGGLWALCDGSVVTLSRDNGTTAAYTTPNLTGNVFILGGAYSAQLAASKPTWDLAAKTDPEAAHTHQVTVPAGISGAESADVAVQSGAGTNVAAAPHTHTTPGETVASGPGSAHSHALSNANAVLNAPSEANGGLPLRINLAWYVRL